MIIRFSEDYLRYTNNNAEIRISGKTIEECILAVFNLYPQLHVHLVHEQAELAQRSLLRLNGKYIYRMEDAKASVSDEDVLEIALAVPSGKDDPIGFFEDVIDYVADNWLYIVTGPYGWWTLVYREIFNAVMEMILPSLEIPDIASGSLNNSSAYTFNGIRNTTASGTPLQVVYGTFRVGGQYLNIYTTSTSSQQTYTDPDGTVQNMEREYDWLHAQIGLCEGEIEAVSDVQINKLPANFYDAVEFIDKETLAINPDFVRYGTNNQTPMPGFTKTSNTTSISRKIVYPVDASGNPVDGMIFTQDLTFQWLNSCTFTAVITSQPVNRATVTVNFPGGLYSVGKEGYTENAVSLLIVYREQGSTAWTMVTGATVSAKQRAEIVKSYDITPSKLEPAVYEIGVIRTTPDHTGQFKLVDECYVKDVTEILDASLSYPATAMLGVSIRATDQLSGSLPTITSLVKGRKIALPMNTNGDAITSKVSASQWSGNLTWDEDSQQGVKYWSDNPVWCLYDLLTNKRFGLHDYYKIDPAKRGIMLANFFTMSQYCDELIPFENKDGETEQRKRFTLNVVIDQSRAASEWINIIAGTMRATCFYTEGLFWIEIDRPKYISQIFNMSSVLDYTLNGMPYRSMSNTYEVQYPNPVNDYEIDSFRIESKEYQLDQTLEERKKALLFNGVTDFEHAKSLAKYALVAGEYLDKTVSFKTGSQGIRCSISDVIGLQHDVPGTGWGGKFTEVVLASDWARVTLSNPFEYVSGTLSLLVEQQGGAPVQLTVSQPVPGPITALTISRQYYPPGQTIQTYTPTVGADYIVTTKTVEPYRVVSISRDSDELVQITAISYDPQIYTLADDTSDLGVYTPPDYSNITSPARVSVLNMRASIKIYKDSSGAIKTGIEVFYQAPSSSFWTGAVVNWGLAGSLNYQSLPVSTTGYGFIPDISVAGNYQIVVTSVYKTGKQTIYDALSDNIYLPFAFLVVTPFVQNDSFLEGVTGLEVVGSQDGTFLGRDCRIRWRAPVVLDQYTHTTASGPAASAETSSWLAYYKVEVFGADGSLRHVAKIGTESFVYSHDVNHADGAPAARSFSVTVTVYDRIGRASKPKILKCSNPPPGALVGVTVSPSVHSFSVSFDPSRELDFSGYLVHAVQQNDLDLDGDFTPSYNNLRYDGPQTSFVVKADTPGAWYVKVAAYDTFEDPDNIDFSNLDYNDAMAVIVLDEALVLPPSLYDELRTDFILNNIRFWFGDAPYNASTAAVLHWDGSVGGEIIRGTEIFTLATPVGTFADATSKYVCATLDKATLTAELFLTDFSAGAPTLVDDDTKYQRVIAITSKNPPLPNTNNICYVRQSNSMEIEGALIRNLTVQANSVVGGILQVGGSGGVSIVSSNTDAKTGMPNFQVSTTGILTCYGAKIYGDVFMSPTSRILWTNITNADSYVTTITKNTITTSYINALNITAANALVARSVAAENITGSMISGKQIRTATTYTDAYAIMDNMDHTFKVYKDRGDGVISLLAHVGGAGFGTYANLFGSDQQGCNLIGVTGRGYSREGVAGWSYTGQGVTGVSSESYGVWGSSQNSHGVLGQSNNGYGVLGYGAVYDVYAGSTGDYGPFTGAHDGLIRKDEQADIGDILCDVKIIYKSNLSNCIAEVAPTNSARTPGVLGVLAACVPYNDKNVPSGLKLRDEDSALPDYVYISEHFAIAKCNAVGEGQINVCKEGGNIEQGDYICSSSRSGKGMRQDDDLLHNYTVAKARESCTWADDEDDVRTIACTYHCG